MNSNVGGVTILSHLLFYSSELYVVTLLHNAGVLLNSDSITQALSTKINA